MKQQVALNRTIVGLKRTRIAISTWYTNSLNRTIVGLKLEKLSFGIRFTIFFESNHCGIETATTRNWQLPIAHFESNHCGIETKISNLVYFLYRLWIEPLWDWNTSASAARAYRLSLNRTIVGLKRASDRCEWQYSELWIEPLWDWNRGDIRNVARVAAFESNHCGIETAQSSSA